MEVNKAAVNNLIRNVEGEMRRVEESGESQITEELVKSLMPKAVPMSVVKEVVDHIHSIEENTGIPQELFEDQFMSYTHLIGQGMPIDKLINAIKFVTFIQAGNTQGEAYALVFPDKVADMKKDNRDWSSFATMYAKTKAVTSIMKTAILSPYITYKPWEAKVMQKLAHLMDGRGAKETDYVSPTVQLNAALGFLAYIKPPDESKLTLNIGMSEDAKAVQQNLADQIAEMSRLQRERFQAGESLKDIQKVGIVIDAEVSDEFETRQCMRN